MVKLALRVICAGACFGTLAYAFLPPTARQPTLRTSLHASSTDQPDQPRRRFFESAAGSALIGGGALVTQHILLAPRSVAMAQDVPPGFEKSASGLMYQVVEAGSGGKPNQNQKVRVDYTGWLDNFESDKKFDSSVDRRRPFEFFAGGGQVIKGWDEAILSMQVGEKRRLIIPPELGYGKRGAGRVIPPDATLYFEVKLLALL
ncbi:unnamed protein product [Vitrella brassicaformis CCMP3155]|uniref:peptidylprolyl isomerase n=1 Tax=Vitrella brassicaformis (strain CCMP3155) TaxID=1169540 RepID=A0A0G4F4Q0_VITBC|nr:unnamed protein product [Vitrella brassicaformis CCMP3155]|eukprot:CEM06696.1 unnamed protein product [Vitrella brassicaformis CCMP3155]